MARRKWLAIVISACLSIAGCGGPAPSAARFGLNDPNTVWLPPVGVPRARMPAGPIPAVFQRPEGNGPLPAVIILHGCGGRGPSQVIWANRLNGWGYAALIPDSLSPRGFKRVCDPDQQPFVTPLDRVGDIASAAAWLRTRPDIDPARITVLGLSHGGAAAVLATQRIYEGIGLRAAINYYGACVDPTAHGTVPLLVLAGEADDWGHPAALCQAYGVLARPDQVCEIDTYAGVFHAFDNPSMTHAVYNGHVTEYNQPAAEDSFARVHAFLDRWVMR